MKNTSNIPQPPDEFPCKNIASCPYCNVQCPPAPTNAKSLSHHSFKNVTSDKPVSGCGKKHKPKNITFRR